MKFLEKLGANVLDHSVFYTVIFALLLLIIAISTFSGGVWISASRFNCTATDAYGINAVCTQFTMKDVYRDLGYKNKANQ